MHKQIEVEQRTFADDHVEGNKVRMSWGSDILVTLTLLRPVSHGGANEQTEIRKHICTMLGIS